MKKTNHSMPDLDIHSLQMRLPIMLSNSNIKLIPCQKIKLIKANRNYSQIIIDTGEEYTHTSCLKSFECRLSGSYFIRCHKSFIVNALFVSEVCKKDKQIVLSDGCILPCSTDAANKIIQLISV